MNLTAPDSSLNFAPALTRAARLFCYLGFATVPMLAIRVASLTISDGLFALALLLAASAAVAGGVIPRPPQILPIAIASLLYVAAGLASSIDLPDEGLLAAAVAVFKLFYLTVVWFLLCGVLLREPAQITRAASLWIYGAALSAVAGLAGVHLGAADEPGHQFAFRAVGLTAHPNDFGASMATALVPAMALAGQARSRIGRYLARICALLITLGLIRSVSASGILSAVVGVSLWSILTGRFKLAVSVVAVSAILAGLVALTLNTFGISLSTATRLYGLTEGQGSKIQTLGLRIRTYENAWAYIEDHPIFGIGTQTGGTGTGVFESGNELAAHNLFIAGWYETGLFGLVALVLLVTLCADLSRRVYRRLKATPLRDLTSAIIAGEAAFFIYSMTAPGLFQRYGWVTVALIFSMSGVVTRPIRGIDGRTDRSSALAIRA